MLRDNDEFRFLSVSHDQSIVLIGGFTKILYQIYLASNKIIRKYTDLNVGYLMGCMFYKHFAVVVGYRGEFRIID